MITFKTEIEIEKPIQKVFDFVTNEKHYWMWNDAVKRIKKITEDPNSEGTSFVMFRELSSGMIKNQLEIIDYNPQLSFTIQTTSGPTPFTYSYIFKKDDKNTKIKLHAEVNAKGIDSQLVPIIAYAIKQGEKKNLRSLKELIEAN